MKKKQIEAGLEMNRLLHMAKVDQLMKSHQLAVEKEMKQYQEGISAAYDEWQQADKSFLEALKKLGEVAK